MVLGKPSGKEIDCLKFTPLETRRHLGKITGLKGIFTTALIRSSKRQYYANLNNKLQDPDTNSKKWWGIVKSLYGQKMFTTVPTLVEGPLMIHDAKDKAELLNEFFCSQSRLDESSSFVPAVPDCIPTSRILSNVVTSEWEITALLGSVNINKACGPDGISNKLIKNLR